MYTCRIVGQMCWKGKSGKEEKKEELFECTWKLLNNKMNQFIVNNKLTSSPVMMKWFWTKWDLVENIKRKNDNRFMQRVFRYVISMKCIKWNWNLLIVGRIYQRTIKGIVRSKGVRIGCIVCKCVGILQVCVSCM